MNDEDLLEEICIRPGAHKSELMRSLGVSWGSLGRGLKRLERRGKVKLIRQGQRTRAYLPAEFPVHVLRGVVAPKKTTVKVAKERKMVAPDPVSPSQRSLLDVVAARPGLTKSGLCRELDLAWGTVSYHLRALRELGLVSVLRDGRQLRVYPAGTKRREMRWLAALSEEVPERIVESLVHGPGRLVEISRRVGRSRTLVRHHLTMLGEAGLVDKEGHEYRLREEQELLQYLRGLSDGVLGLLDSLKEEA